MKKITWTLPIALILMLTNCSDDSDYNVQIRVRNTGPFTYNKLIVISDDSGEVPYGHISSNQTSQYRYFKYTYQQQAYIQFSVDGKEYRLTADCLTEEPIKEGKFTYEIAMDPNKIMTVKFIQE